MVRGFNNIIYVVSFFDDRVVKFFFFDGKFFGVVSKWFIVL